MMKSILPIASFDLATKVRDLGFREPVFAKYRDGVLDEGGSAFEDYNGLKESDDRLGTTAHELFHQLQ